MTRSYFHSVYSAVLQNITNDNNKGVYCSDGYDYTPYFCVVFVQIFSGKNVTSSKIAALVVYIVHAGLLDRSVPYRRWIIQKVLSLMGFPPIQFGAIVQSDAESKFGDNFAHVFSQARMKFIPKQL